MKKLIIILFAALFAWPATSWAQGCMEPSGEEGVQVIGFIQPQFQYDFLGTEELTGDNLNESSFYFNRARLGVMGTIPYDFSYYVMFEFSPTLNGIKDGTPPLLLDGFISYNRFAPYVKFSLGQFKSPFGQELLTPCHKLHTINRATAVVNLVSPWRDMGLMVSGGTGDLSILGSKTENFFGYSFAILNGAGINQWDNNNSKDYVGRLTVHPFDFVTVGASYRFGRQPAQSPDATEEDTRERFGLDVELKYKGFLVQGEYVNGADVGSYTTGGGCGGDVEIHEGSVNRDGFYITALYRTPWNFEPVVRFERYNPNLDEPPADVSPDPADYTIQNSWTFGLNYFFNDKVRLQANYLYNAETTPDWMNRYVEVSNDAFLLQMQIVF